MTKYAFHEVISNIISEHRNLVNKMRLIFILTKSIYLMYYCFRQAISLKCLIKHEQIFNYNKS